MNRKAKIRAFFTDTLFEYAAELLHRWAVIGFFVLIGAVGALADMADYDIPGWIWWSVAALGVFVAQFVIWNDMKKERDALRRFDVKQGTLAALSGYRGRLITLQNEPITTEVEFGAWKERYSRLRHEIMDVIAKEISPAEAMLFETLGDYERVGIAGKRYVNMEQFEFTARVIRDHRWLAKAVQDYGRQRFRPELFDDGANDGQ